MPGDGQDGVPDCDKSSSGAATFSDPLVAGCQEGGRAGGAGGGLAQGATQPRIALTRGGAALAFAGGLLDLWGELRPRHQMRVGGEHGHVDADLGEDVLCTDPAHARDFVELVYLVLKRGDQLFDSGSEVVDLGAEPVDVVQHDLAHEGVMVVEVARQRLLQSADFDAHPSLGQLSKDFRVALPGDQGFDHRPA